MKMAFREAQTGIRAGDGGPFGAVIVKNGKLISSAHNEVLLLNDPSAHAEIQAIRKACRILNDFNLEGCVIYTTCEPCPMCLGAIYWSGITGIYFGCDRYDAGKHGFSDKTIYDEIQSGFYASIKMNQINYSECSVLFDEWEKSEGKRMY